MRALISVSSVELGVLVTMFSAVSLLGHGQQTTCKSAVVRPLIPLGLLSGVQMTQRQPCLWVTYF